MVMIIIVSLACSRVALLALVGFVSFVSISISVIIITGAARWQPARAPKPTDLQPLTLDLRLHLAAANQCSSNVKTVQLPKFVIVTGTRLKWTQSDANTYSIKIVYSKNIILTRIGWHLVLGTVSSLFLSPFRRLFAVRSKIYNYVVATQYLRRMFWPMSWLFDCGNQARHLSLYNREIASNVQAFGPITQWLIDQSIWFKCTIK